MARSVTWIRSKIPNFLAFLVPPELAPVWNWSALFPGSRLAWEGEERKRHLETEWSVEVTSLLLPKEPAQLWSSKIYFLGYGRCLQKTPGSSGRLIEEYIWGRPWRAAWWPRAAGLCFLTIEADFTRHSTYTAQTWARLSALSAPCSLITHMRETALIWDLS